MQKYAMMPNGVRVSASEINTKSVRIAHSRESSWLVLKTRVGEFICEIAAYTDAEQKQMRAEILKFADSEVENGVLHVAELPKMCGLPGRLR